MSLIVSLVSFPVFCITRDVDLTDCKGLLILCGFQIEECKKKILLTYLFKYNLE